MGAVAGGHCYADAVAAAQAECSAYPRTSTDGGTVVSWSCQGVATDGSSLSLLKTDAAGGSVAQTVALSYPACDEMASYSDASAMWALGLSACAAVYCVKVFVVRLVSNQ